MGSRAFALASTVLLVATAGCSGFAASRQGGRARRGPLGARPARLASTAPGSLVEGISGDEGGRTGAGGAGRRAGRRGKAKKEKVDVTTAAELYRQVDELDTPLGDLRVVGDLVHHFDHPTMELIRKRVKEGSKPGSRAPGDTAKLAIAFEGGGMRGCVGAGMAVCLWYTGVLDAADVVYGSSAGSLIGAYVVARQNDFNFGPEIYYDMLPLAGKKFIDMGHFLRCVGLGPVTFKPRLWRELLSQRMGSPVLNLDYLLGRVVKSLKPLNYDEFARGNERQPLKIVASGLLSNASVVLDSESGNFRNLDELTRCMWASMLLPGITGPAVRLDKQMSGSSVRQTPWFAWDDGWKTERLEDCGEPLGDAMIFEPIPWRSAVKEGATHVLACRTRPDGVSVTSKQSVLEKMLYRRYFKKKHRLPHMADHMNRQRHKVIYAEDVLVLNKESRKRSKDSGAAPGPDTDVAYDSTEPHLACVALPTGSPEIARLEMDRKEILEGVRRGFAACYDQTHPDEKQRGRGWEVAMTLFGDDILDRLPEESVVDGAPYKDLPGVTKSD